MAVYFYLVAPTGPVAENFAFGGVRAHMYFGQVLKAPKLE